jgi:hypothetical protein
MVPGALDHALRVLVIGELQIDPLTPAAGEA